MIDRTGNSSVFSGCFSFLKPNISFSVPTGREWFGDPMNLVGKNPPIYTYLINGGLPQWFSISFPGKFIHPTSYGLLGRISGSGNNLKTWTFDGLTSDNEWKILQEENSELIEGETRIIPVLSNEVFISFRINMTGPNNGGNYFLNLGQIEVFGYIYDTPPSFYELFHPISIICFISAPLRSILLTSILLVTTNNPNLEYHSI